MTGAILRGVAIGIPAGLLYLVALLIRERMWKKRCMFAFRAGKWDERQFVIASIQAARDQGTHPDSWLQNYMHLLMAEAENEENVEVVIVEKKEES